MLARVETSGHGSVETSGHGSVETSGHGLALVPTIKPGRDYGQAVSSIEMSVLY